jgi:hypothetical protein
VRASPTWATLAIGIFWLAALGCSSSPSGTTTGELDSVGLLAGLRVGFLKVNPAIRQVYVLEVRPNPAVPPGKAYAVLATGIAPNPNAEVNFSNELFGVFTADSTLTRILEVIDIFPTRRWRDYWVRFAFIGPDSLFVRGSGRAHGDQPLVRTYDWGMPQSHLKR